MSKNFWVVETLRLKSKPEMGHHWHCIFSLAKPKGVKVIAGPFDSDGEAVDWLNAHVDEQP